MSTIALKSLEGHVYPIDFDAALIIERIKTIVDRIKLMGGRQEYVINLDVNSLPLKLAIQWATHHKDNPLALDFYSRHNRTDILPWDADFLKDLDPEKQLSLMLTANRLEMPVLYDLVAKTLINFFNSKTTTEVQQGLGIMRNSIPDQEDQ